MSYRNKTYVIFDGDNDMWAYAYMKGWNESEHIAFDFYDAHDLHPLTERASEDTVRDRLRQRLANSKQAIGLIGESTRHLYKFVRWEIETALDLDFPMIGVNLNGSRQYESERCPPILRDKYVVHVPFKAKIIQYALDNFPAEYAKRDPNAGGNRHYNDSVYTRLGI
jgi:Thoeris protein ThsB, TIR-like domain